MLLYPENTERNEIKHWSSMKIEMKWSGLWVTTLKFPAQVIASDHFHPFYFKSNSAQNESEFSSKMSSNSAQKKVRIQLKNESELRSKKIIFLQKKKFLKLVFSFLFLKRDEETFGGLINTCHFKTKIFFFCIIRRTKNLSTFGPT